MADFQLRFEGESLLSTEMDEWDQGGREHRYRGGVFGPGLKRNSELMKSKTRIQKIRITK